MPIVTKVVAALQQWIQPVSPSHIIYIYMCIYRYVCTGQNVPNVISMDYNVYYVAGIYVNDDFEIMFITRNILIFYSYSHVSCHVPMVYT